MEEMTVSVPEAGRARGHNALLAALDTEINIKDSDGARKAKAKKQRDTKKLKLDFRLEVIQIGHDAKGEPVTSCVVVRPGVSAKEDFTTQELGISEIDGRVLRALQQATEKYPADPPEKIKALLFAGAAKEKDWRSHFYDSERDIERDIERDKGDLKQSALRARFRRGRTNLLLRSLIETSQGYAWVKGDE